jgi:hypothetical protein
MGAKALAGRVSASRLRRSGLMQQLLTGRTRFKEFVRDTQQVDTR